MKKIAIFSHHAMATKWEVRIAGEDPVYAAQAAAAAFQWADRIEALLSRFREESELSGVARLSPGGRMRLSEPTFFCLSLAREWEVATGSAFSAGATAVRLGLEKPIWRLDTASRELIVGNAPCLLDAGAIGKGFALDRIAEELEADYPDVKFYDMEYDHPELNEVCNHSEFSDFVEIPYIIYYKKGVVVNTTSGTRTKAEIKRILDKEFVPTVTDTIVNYDLNFHTCSQLGCEIKSEVT